MIYPSGEITAPNQVCSGGRVVYHLCTCEFLEVYHLEQIYRVAQNHGKQVLRISHIILSFLDEIASAS